jgi:SH3 domain-containing protein
MLTRARLAVVLGVLIVGLVACGGGSKPPAASSHSPTPSASAKAKPTLAGPYIVKAAGCLHIRSSPTIKATALSCVPAGSLVIADGKSKKNEGYTWLHVTFNNVTGWAVSTYLKKSGTLVTPSPAAS